MLLCPLLLGRSLPGQHYGLLEGFRGLGGFHFNIGLPWCLALLLSLGLPSSCGAGGASRLLLHLRTFTKIRVSWGYVPCSPSSKPEGWKPKQHADSTSPGLHIPPGLGRGWRGGWRLEKLEGRCQLHLGVFQSSVEQVRPPLFPWPYPNLGGAEQCPEILAARAAPGAEVPTGT